MSRIDEPVAVVLSQDGAPEKIEWRSQRFRVTDTPTRLGCVPDFVLDFLTHPPRNAAGWRFQGTADDGVSHIFDITLDADRGLWFLVRTYD